MNLELPPELKSMIRDRYLAGVADAQDKYQFSSADEDSLTGALGNNISMARPLIYRDGHRQFRYQISYQKIRGRGPDAPEKHLGADGIFQIEVHDENGVRRKGLPFQSKKGWHGTDSRLLSQTIDMIHTAGGGIVVDYRPGQYTACLAHDVVQRQANRRQIDRAGKSTSLGQLLGNEFLDCKIGQVGLFYDAETETWQTELMHPPTPEHVITTKVTMLS